MTNATILIVEDDQSLRTVIRLVLEGVGYQIVEATNGRDALQLIEVGRVDAVVSDVRMPLLSGEELVAQIRSDPRIAEIPTLLLSGFDLGPTRLGADAVLKKPFDARQLVQAVRRLV